MASDLSFKNEESVVMNSASQLGSAHGFGISQFGGNGFRSEFDGMGINMAAGGSEQQMMRPNLSLWLNQLGNNPRMNMNSHLEVGPNSGIYMSPSSSSSLPEINMQMPQPNNTFAPSNSVTNNYSPSSLPIGKKGESSGGNLASIYSSDSRNNPSKPASPMSATALLQKAAQMGSTRSSNPSIFSGSFGVMSSSSSQTAASLENNNADNHQNQVYHHQSMKQSENNFSSNSSGVGTLGMSNNNNFSSLTHSSTSGLDELVSQSHGRQCNNKQVQMKLHPDANTSGEHGYTRDFLGMSGPGGAGSPFLPQELAKFASMASSMGMSQFPSTTTQ